MCFKCSPSPLATSTSCEIASFHETRMPIRSRWFFAIFLGQTTKKNPMWKPFTWPFCSELCFWHQIPSTHLTHHHWSLISKALARCIDTNTIYGEAAFGHAFIFDRWTDTYRSACTCPIWSTSKRFGPNAPFPWLFGKCHVNILSGAE